MKIITLSKVGYNMPSQANWSWGIWKLDLIDTERDYNMSHTLKENFGGDSRLRNHIEKETGYRILETNGVFPTQSIKGIRAIGHMESEETYGLIKDFLKD